LVHPDDVGSKDNSFESGGVHPEGMEEVLGLLEAAEGTEGEGVDWCW